MPIRRLFDLSGKRWQEFYSIQILKCFSYVIGTIYKHYAIRLIFGHVVLTELFRYAVQYVLFNRSELSYVSTQVTQLRHFRVEWRFGKGGDQDCWSTYHNDRNVFSNKLAVLSKSELVLPYVKRSLLKKLYFLCFPDQIWLLPWELTPITFSWQL